MHEFYFTNTYSYGNRYDVQITVSPITQICELSNGTGIIGETDVTNLVLFCYNRKLFSIFFSTR